MRIRSYLTLAALFPVFAAADVHYTLTAEPENKSVRVTIMVDDPKDSESYRIPAWCPGFYTLKNYETKISYFKAVDTNGAALPVQHPSSRQWVVSTSDKSPYKVSYRVLGDDPGLGFFGTSVLQKTAFVNGPSAFMYVDGRLVEPTHLKINVPQGWKTATAADADGEGGYKAGGYDELIDHPIQMGLFETRKFEVGGIPYEVVFVSKDQRYNCDLDFEAEQLRIVSAPALRLFGGAQFKRYVYFLHLSVGDFSGGLEHRASNVIATYNSNKLGLDDLAAHEYFHAWNVKQIRPKILGPFDYTDKQRTANLWFSEGVTDYYAQITTYRSGLQDKAWLYRQLGGNVSELQRSRDRLKYTLADCSRQTWEHSGFATGDLSYYTKGLLCGWILDAAIRDATDGEKSLDDVMRTMYQRYRLPKPGFEENGVLTTVNEVAGKDLTALYNRLINSTEELPYEELAKIGITVDRSGRVMDDGAANEKASRLRNSWLDRAGSLRQ